MTIFKIGSPSPVCICPVLLVFFFLHLDAQTEKDFLLKNNILAPKWQVHVCHLKHVLNSFLGEVFLIPSQFLASLSLVSCPFSILKLSLNF